MTEISALTVQRGHLKASLTKLKTFADNISPNKTVEELEVRLEKLEEVANEFKEVDHALELAGTNSEYDVFEDKYLEVKATLRKHLNERILERNKVNASSESKSDSLNSTVTNLIEQQKALISSMSRTPPSTSSQVKLPKIELPSFSGDYKDWPSFKDLFTSCVGNRNDLSDGSKLQFLKGALRGEAAITVKHLAVTDANYKEAWDKLVKRYDKKRQIVSAYIKAFINQPTCSQVPQNLSTSLRRLADTSDQLIRGIKVIGTQAAGRDPWLIYILLSKLDPETRKLWAEESTNIDFPTFDSFITFLSRRCDALEVCDPNFKKQSSNHQVRNLHLNVSESCIKCSKLHPLFKCPDYKALSISDRRNLIQQHHLCFNCLNSGHSAKACKSKYKCHFCKQSHHSSLHQTITSQPHAHFISTSSTSNSQLQPTQPTASTLDPSTPSFTPNTSNGSHIHTYTIFKERDNKVTLLPTALVRVRDNQGRHQLCRVLLDSGSQASFVSEDCVKRLGLQREKAKIMVHGLSSTRTLTTKGVLSILLFSRFSSDQTLCVQAYVLDKLTAPQPSRNLNFTGWTHIYDRQLADPQFNISQRIDILIGADYFFQIIQDGQEQLPQELKLQSTIFGFIVTGQLREESNSTYTSSFQLNISDIELTMRKFWEIEELPTRREEYTDEERACETWFTQTLQVDQSTGRYIVRLPFKRNSASLGHSLLRAIQCLKSQERRFQNNKHLHNEYKLFMTEYKDLTHMELIPDSSIETVDQHAYLSHHAVLKLSSTTTKVRVVFNGSAPTSNGVSLNQILMIGPKTQRDLVPIILSFRAFKVAVVADIEKMYRQILVDERDRTYQRIVWRNELTQPIQHFWLNTVTYGTSAAPYLATRCLKQLTIEFQGQYPLAENALNNHFYVDDLLGGADNELQAQALYHELTELLQKRGLHLRKWASNSEEFMRAIQGDFADKESLRIDEYPESLKVLGLKWMQREDCFSFDVVLPEDSAPTKRNILSESSKIFDPLGFVAPVTVTFKIIIQQLWLKKYDWDEPCGDIAGKWLALRNDLHKLQKLRVPRHFDLTSTGVELHGFADASEMAYAAVVYCRSTDCVGNVSVTLLAAKTRVCPIKQVSIPRLELCAAVLLTNLLSFITSNLTISIDNCFAWTDSTVVLHWLSSHPRKWKCFVANRTSSILSVIPRSRWNHVISTDNPADLASRGLTSSQLVDSTLWWNGPRWLRDNWNEVARMNQPLMNDVNEDGEKRKSCFENYHTATEDHLLSALFTKFSCLLKIISILSRCFQFVRKCKHNNQGDSHGTSWILVEDVNNAYRSLIIWSQSEAFEKEIHRLKSNLEIQPSSRILSLTPYIDDLGILRVGGRLENASISATAKHPAILPKDHIFVKYLLKHLHEKYLHAGTSMLLSIVRQNYWILSCRAAIKSTINKCLTCVKHRAATSRQLMANLPHFRVNKYKPFENVGVDYAGPIQLLVRRGRGAPTTKGYIALFVCFSTRAIHLELAGDLLTDTFISCLKRFVSRRGLPYKIFSDNGTNFVGAKRYLNELHKTIMTLYKNELIANFLSSNSIIWDFNPPSAPHFGGLWEAGVKSVKAILKKVIGETRLTYEEFNTLLIQIEGLLNSRPLTPASDDISCLDALTPAHFLLGQPLTTLPEPPTSQGMSLKERWRLIQRLHQDFWKRWYHEYLTTLQNRPKWQRVSPNLKIGDMVTLKDDNLPPAKWIIGRIVDTHPGQDGLVRVASIKTSHGVVRRPTIKLCKLPTEE